MEIVVALIVTIAAVAAVLYPLIRGDRAGMPIESEEADRAEGDVESEVARYRTALRAGTLCRRCGRANPEASFFCAECGRRLPAGRTPRSRRKGA
jgi:hypothetical protein